MSLPSTPQVVPATPGTPSDVNSKDYFGPTTRSAARKSRVSTPAIPEDANGIQERRSRTRSRSPVLERNLTGLTSASLAAKTKSSRRKVESLKTNGDANGHLQPPKRSWRDISRSPSPLGLIPIHLEFRSFIHRHEIPRKALHVSIGFLTAYLYTTGTQPEQIHPVLLAALIPIATTDLIRHRFSSINKFYIRVLGPLMRESEVQGYNGVIWYLLGAWAVLRFCPKDIGGLGIMLLSWCDTAASTFGRLWGRYTPKVRKGKSLAGSIAAMFVGVVTAAWFWGYLAPRHGQTKGWDTGEHAFAFQGTLSVPASLRKNFGWKEDEGTISGVLALLVISIWTGLVASVSEAIDIFGWDDNLTIPVLSAAGLWAFLKAFASG